MKTMPTLVALRANFDGQEQFVTYVTEGKKKGLLELSTTEGLFSPKTTFAIEQAGEGLVHIKSVYNGKYLCRAPSIILEDDESAKGKSLEESEICMINLGANEAVKEKSAWDCTLFEINFHDEVEDENDDGFEIENVVSLIHAKLKYAIMVIPNDTNKEELSLVMKKCGDNEEAFHFTAIRSVMRLPPRVNFFGDNQMFIRHVRFENRDYNQFSGSNGMSQEAMYEVHYQNNTRHDIRVMSQQVNRFWRRSPNWIWADSTDRTWNNPDTVFQVVQLSNNQIALRNNGNGRFCSRFTAEGKTSMLNANTANLNTYSQLLVGEPVSSRLVTINDYQLQNANLVHLTPIISGVFEHTNTSFTSSVEKKIQLNVRREAAHTWSQTNTLSTGLVMTLSAGVPYIDSIAGSSLSISQVKSQSLTWGEEVSESTIIKDEEKIIIQPRTRSITTCFLKQAMYNIPFTYTQTDTLPTGQQIRTVAADGICHGREIYDFTVETKSEPI